MKNEYPIARNRDSFIGAKTLVAKYVELLKLVPDKNKWTEDNLKKYPNQYYRLLQLKGLCRIFDIESIDSLLSGDFIYGRDKAQYESIYSIILSMEATAKKNRELELSGSSNRSHCSVYAAPKTKGHLKKIVDAYLSHFENLENSLSIKWKGDFSDKPEERRERTIFVIDMATMNICQIIEPSRKQVTIGEAIDNYGCPDVDVYALDKIEGV